MAIEGPVLAQREAVPVLEQSKGYVCTVTSVGTSATAIPATNLSRRRGLIVQNLHASQDLYVGGNTIPELVVGNVHRMKEKGREVTLINNVEWKLSAGGTNEWYAVARGDTTPGFTQPVLFYYSTVGGGAETSGTIGTVGAIAAQHGLGWGDGDTLGFNTIYVRTDGATPANSPALKYDYILSYVLLPDSSTNYGVKLGPLDGVTLNMDGSVRVLAIGSGAATTALTMEFL